MSDDEGASFNFDALRGDVLDEGTGEGDGDERDLAERAFEQARAAIKPEPLASLNSLESWLGRPSKKKQLELNPVDVELAKATIKLRARDLDVRLKNLLALFAVIAVSVQLAVADSYFVHGALAGQTPPSDTVLVAWLSSTVVEVIGIVAIVARNLFPEKGKGKEQDRAGSKKSE